MPKGVSLPAASSQREALLHRQDLLGTNASKQTAELGTLKEEIRACDSCCLRTQAQLQTARTELAVAQGNLIEQESALNELSKRGENRTGRQPLISRHAGHPT